jgi:membrane-anchored glycerophosphoryl diester phosphodiesterase (GDPDase)
VIAGASGGLQIAILLLLLFAVIWLATRFILVLPGVALENAAAGLRWSWRLTRGHGAALFLAFCAVSLPLLVAKYGLMIAVGAPLLAVDSPSDTYQPLLWQPLFRLIDFANMAISIAFMSFAYAAFIRD